MLTQAKEGIFKPKDFLTEILPELSSFEEALLIPKWTHAMQCEYESLIKNGTCSFT